MTGHWTQQAACAGVPLNVFFPPPGGSTWPAKAICAQCPVKAECLEEAMRTDISGTRWGVFGGMTPGERSLLHTQRGPNAETAASAWLGVPLREAARQAGVTERTISRRRAALKIAAAAGARPVRHLELYPGATAEDAAAAAGVTASSIRRRRRNAERTAA